MKVLVTKRICILLANRIQEDFRSRNKFLSFELYANFNPHTETLDFDLLTLGHFQLIYFVNNTGPKNLSKFSYSWSPSAREVLIRSKINVGGFSSIFKQTIAALVPQHCKSSSKSKHFSSLIKNNQIKSLRVFETFKHAS